MGARGRRLFWTGLALLFAERFYGIGDLFGVRPAFLHPPVLAVGWTGAVEVAAGAPFFFRNQTRPS